jgi:acid phosphatase family membrane protein YuiD
MPSGHSATMAGLTMALFYSGGFSPVFYLALFVTLIVFRDATGVRLESSRQAAILNKMLKKAEPHHKLLKELIGHTRRQVLAGAIIGVVVASFLYIITL